MQTKSLPMKHSILCSVLTKGKSIIIVGTTDEGDGKYVINSQKHFFSDLDRCILKRGALLDHKSKASC